MIITKGDKIFRERNHGWRCERNLKGKEDFVYSFHDCSKRKLLQEEDSKIGGERDKWTKRESRAEMEGHIEEGSSWWTEEETGRNLWQNLQTTSNVFNIILKEHIPGKEIQQ